MNTVEIREHKTNLKITERQKEILIGLLLGDGHLETQNNGRTFRLKIEHSVKQLDYTEWLYREFHEWVNGGIYRRKRNDKKDKEHVGFTTYSHPAFRFYAQQFYRNGEKIVPEMISKMLSPIALSVWFMDD